MRTGSFRNCAKIPGAVSISRGVPDYFRGPQYKPVAPRWDMLKMEQADYDRELDLILEKLNPEEVYQDLIRLGGPDPILLCWEKPNDSCHRRRVAEWLEESLGIVITEYGFDRSEILPYSRPSTPAIPQEKQLDLF